MVALSTGRETERRETLQRGNGKYESSPLKKKRYSHAPTVAQPLRRTHQQNSEGRVAALQLLMVERNKKRGKNSSHSEETRESKVVLTSTENTKQLQRKFVFEDSSCVCCLSVSPARRLAAHCRLSAGRTGRRRRKREGKGLGGKEGGERKASDG